MATTVTKTIGTGGDYTTLQSWEDAAPANLVTVDQIWQGQCFNQEFFSSSSGLLNVSGSTSDATRYKELTTYAGASFIDNANVQTNALRYNASNGAGIRGTYPWTAPVSVGEAYFRISRLQIASNTGRAFGVTAATGFVMDKCIVENSSTASGSESLSLYGAGIVKNTLVVGRSTGALAALSNGASAYNCTFARTGTSTSNIFVGNYSSTTLKNCAFFGGATTLASGSSVRTYTTCYTDTASPPTGCTTVAYDTSTGSGFQNKTDATRDFRIKTGSALLDVGTTDTTNAAADIVGTARPQGSAYDVGAWELVVATGDYTASITEATTLAATASSQAALDVAATEAATLSHSQSVAIGYAAANVESAALTDSVSAITNLSSASVEAVTLAADASLSFSATVTIDEAATLDAAQSSTYAATASATEAMALADTAAGALAGGAFSASATEAAALADTSAQQYGASGALVEALPLADTVGNVTSLSAATSESLPLDTVLFGGAVYAVTLVESAPLVDTHSVTAQFTSTAVEALALAETQVQQAALTAAMVEVLSLASDASAAWGAYAALVASITLDTTASQVLNAMFTASDAWAYQIAPNNLRYTVPVHSLRYTVAPHDLTYAVAAQNLAYDVGT